MISSGYLEQRYSKLKAVASAGELDVARDDLIQFLRRRLAESNVKSPNCADYLLMRRR